MLLHKADTPTSCVSHRGIIDANELITTITTDFKIRENGAEASSCEKDRNNSASEPKNMFG